MTQEDKELLLKDLCARLPYGVKIELMPITRGKCTTLTPLILRDYYISDDVNYLPYLRPMSSMTEEEKEELKELFDAEEVTTDSLGFTEGGTLEDYISQVSYDFCGSVTDWLLAHHFDYRFPGLIEKGLALEASERMYNLKKK